MSLLFLFGPAVAGEQAPAAETTYRPKKGGVFRGEGRYARQPRKLHRYTGPIPVYDTSALIDFETPSGNINGTQTFRVLVRKDSLHPWATATPTVDIELWENGSFVSTLVSGTNVTSDTGQVIEATWSASAVSNLTGATVQCKPSNLLQFAHMGATYARVGLGIDRPRVGLLSVGEEETKGNDLTRDAHQLLKASTLSFIGNVEARGIFAGDADVIVCDGFTGNVALKLSEGLVEMVEGQLGEELQSTFSSQVGYLLSRRAFRRFRKRVDYSEFGGAPLLGVASLCIVGHGRSSAKAVRNAVVMASRMASNRMMERLKAEMNTLTVGES